MWDFSHFYGIKIYMINSKTKKAPEYRIVYIGKESDNKETGIRRHYIPVEKPEDFKIQQKIEEIEQDEWEKEIMNLSNNYKSNKKLLEIINLHVETRKKKKDQKRIENRKRCNKIYDESSDDEKKQMRLILEQIKYTDEKIKNKRTVFILPCIKQEEKEEIEKYKKLISIMRDEINVLLDDPKIEPPFSFAKDDIPDDYINMHDELVEQVLPLTTGWFLKIHEDDLYEEGPIILEGPTGSGKTSAAKLFAAKCGKEFHPHNVSGISETLVESYIRGFIKGSFTGAEKDREGWFESANNGILFLDDFQNACSFLRTQLLDLLDPNTDKVTVAKIGSNSKDYNVKVFIAVNETITDLVKKEDFQEDLYQRFNYRIEFPSFNELLKEDGSNDIRGGLTVEKYLKKLLWIYRCKHPLDRKRVADRNLRKGIHGIFFNISHLNSLFPEFEEIAFDAIKETNWKGNFREFEKIMKRIFRMLETDELKIPITGEDIKKVINEIGLLQNNKTETNETASDKVREVEAALRKNNFIFKNTVKEKTLIDYKVGDVKTLKKIIRENYNSFSEDIKKNSKIKKIVSRHHPK